MKLKKSLGFAQIFILAGLLLMAVAIPVVTKLVQNNQDLRNKATETISDGSCTVTGIACASGKAYIDSTCPSGFRCGTPKTNPYTCANCQYSNGGVNTCTSLGYKGGGSGTCDTAGGYICCAAGAAATITMAPSLTPTPTCVSNGTTCSPLLNPLCSKCCNGARTVLLPILHYECGLAPANTPTPTPKAIPTVCAYNGNTLLCGTPVPTASVKCGDGGTIGECGTSGGCSVSTQICNYLLSGGVGCTPSTYCGAVITATPTVSLATVCTSVGSCCGNGKTCTAFTVGGKPAGARCNGGACSLPTPTPPCVLNGNCETSLPCCSGRAVLSGECPSTPHMQCSATGLVVTPVVTALPTPTSMPTACAINGCSPVNSQSACWAVAFGNGMKTCVNDPTYNCLTWTSCFKPSPTPTGGPVCVHAGGWTNPMLVPCCASDSIVDPTNCTGTGVSKQCKCIALPTAIPSSSGCTVVGVGCCDGPPAPYCLNGLACVSGRCVAPTLVPTAKPTVGPCDGLDKTECTGYCVWSGGTNGKCIVRPGVTITPTLPSTTPACQCVNGKWNQYCALASGKSCVSPTAVPTTFGGCQHDNQCPGYGTNCGYCMISGGTSRCVSGCGGTPTIGPPGPPISPIPTVKPTAVPPGQCTPQGPVSSGSPAVTANTIGLTWSFHGGTQEQICPQINWRVRGSSSAWKTVNLTHATSYTITGLSPATIYDIYIKSYKTSGGACTDGSAACQFSNTNGSVNSANPLWTISTSGAGLCTQCPNDPTAKGKGDADCNGSTTINDASIWRSEFIAGGLGATSKSTWAADFDCDGKVTINDFSIWRANFTKSLGLL